MDISISSDLKQLTKKLNDIQLKQVPFATSQALNDVAYDSMVAVKHDMPKWIMSPTPFTVRGVRYKRSTKRKLVSEVFIEPRVWAYLRYQVNGGTVSKNKGVAVPTSKKKLNKYGNIAGRRSGIIKRGQYVATMNGRTGIFRNVGRGKNMEVEMLIGFHDKVNYKAVFPYKDIVMKQVN
jgi:hypothetical protein